MIDYLMLKEIGEVYILKTIYEAEAKKPLSDSMVAKFERAGLAVTYVDHLHMMVEGNYMRVGYKLGEVEFGFITNEPVFVRLSPKFLPED